MTSQQKKSEQNQIPVHFLNHPQHGMPMAMSPPQHHQPMMMGMPQMGYPQYYPQQQMAMSPPQQQMAMPPPHQGQLYTGSGPNQSSSQADYNPFESASNQFKEANPTTGFQLEMNDLVDEDAHPPSEDPPRYPDLYGTQTLSSQPSYTQDDPFGVEAFSNIKKMQAQPLSPNTLRKMVPESSTRKCKRCSKWYSLEDAKKLDACCFHVGHYDNIYKSQIAVGSISRWSCCKSLERDDPGCKRGSHLECKMTSKNLAHFEDLAEQHTQFPAPPRPQPQRSNKPTIIQKLGPAPKADHVEQFLDEAKIKKTESSDEKLILYDTFLSREKKSSIAIDDQTIVYQNDEPFIKHHVKMTDTLNGLSLKYQIPIEDLKNVNNIRGNEKEIFTRSILLIPFKGQEIQQPSIEETKQQKEQMKRRLITKFSYEHKVKANEATYYLELCNWNYEDAINEYKEDLLWSRDSVVEVNSVKVK